MALPPFTHHELLSLVGPFTRQGWHADLAASDRAERRLAFRPHQHAPEGALPTLQETLVLDNPERGFFRLTRTLAPAGGPEATLHAEGDDPAALLALLQAVPPARQFHVTPAATVALHQRAAADGGLVLQRAEARLAGLVLKMKLSGVAGFPAELELLRPETDPLRLPTDVLAVLGRPWERLTPVKRGWVGSLALRGDGPARSRGAEERLLQTVEHLAQTLAEPPARFHERHLRARWRVAMRGTLPLVAGVALVSFAFMMRDREGGASVLAILANIAPPLMMGLFFMRREMPQIGLPRPPRRPAGSSWRG